MFFVYLVTPPKLRTAGITYLLYLYICSAQVEKRWNKVLYLIFIYFVQVENYWNNVSYVFIYFYSKQDENRWKKRLFYIIIFSHMLRTAGIWFFIYLFSSPG